MKIFTEPKVYLIARPQINWTKHAGKDGSPGVLDFFRDMENYGKTLPSEAWKDSERPMLRQVMEDYVMDADALAEFCGRMCYCSFGDKQGRKTNQDYIQNIVGQGHGSVLEHANFTFLVTQCSRGFTHEMVRHRAGFGYSQESTHFIDYSPETGRMILDERACSVEAVHDAMGEMAEHALAVYQQVYDSLRKQGHAKKEACSMARQLLPTGIEAKLAFTGNVRALRHFIVLRGNAFNVMEIRKVAVEVFKLMVNEAPNSMVGISLVKNEKDGKEEIACQDNLRKV